MYIIAFITQIVMGWCVGMRESSARVQGRKGRTYVYVYQIYIIVYNVHYLALNDTNLIDVSELRNFYYLSLVDLDFEGLEALVNVHTLMF
jgi:hypothetical protein